MLSGSEGGYGELLCIIIVCIAWETWLCKKNAAKVVERGGGNPAFRFACGEVKVRVPFEELVQFYSAMHSLK